MKTKKGFTLIELLVVIAIIALLLSIILPSLRAAKDHGRRLICLNNLKQIGLGVFLYTDENKGYFPSPWLFQFGNGLEWPDKTVRPEVETGQIYHYLESKDVFLCPCTPRNVGGLHHENDFYWGFDRVSPYTPWSYVMNWQPNRSGAKPRGGPIRLDDLRRSPSGIIMIFDQYPKDQAAYDNTAVLVSRVYTEGADSLTDYHRGGGTILYFDSHVDIMPRLEFIDRLSTEGGTLALFGGHEQMTW